MQLLAGYGYLGNDQRLGRGYFPRIDDVQRLAAKILEPCRVRLNDEFFEQLDEFRFFGIRCSAPVTAKREAGDSWKIESLIQKRPEPFDAFFVRQACFAKRCEGLVAHILDEFGRVRGGSRGRVNQNKENKRAKRCYR